MAKQLVRVSTVVDDRLNDGLEEVVAAESARTGYKLSKSALVARLIREKVAAHKANPGAPVFFEPKN